MTTMVNLPTIVQTREAGGYGKLVAALAGLAVLGTATYLACKNPSDEEKAN